MAGGGQQPRYFPLVRGMDLITPAVSKPQDAVIASVNYEPMAAGYRRLRGFERHDGRTSPSTTVFYRINFTGGLNTPVAGDEFTRGPGPYWELGIIVTVTVQSGSFGTADAQGYLIVAIRGDPTANVNGQLRKYPGLNIGTAVGTPILIDGVLALPYIQDLPALARAKIQPVPGSGPVRGIIFLEGVLHAFRDNVGATEGRLYYSSYGWQQMLLGYTATFDQGGIDGLAIEEGKQYDSVSGVGSNPSIANVYHASVTSGDWTTGDAAGILTADQGMFPLYWSSGDYLYRYSPAGTLRVVRLTSEPAAITLPPGGNYRAIVHNFYGAANKPRAYFVSGVGPAFALGAYGSYSAAIPISTGMAIDKPNRVAEHQNSLFLSFPGGSLQFSAVGDPFAWTPLLGAGEFTVGSDVTDFATPPEALAIFSEDGIHILYGNDASDYTLKEMSDAAGGLANTAQEISGVTYMDNRGLRSLTASQNFGNFQMATISRMVAPLIEAKRRENVTPTASLVCRAADQYWLFFSDGTGLVVYMGGKNPSILPVDLGVVVTCTASREENGIERIFFGADNGYVYELNKGTSFDGLPIEYYVRLAFNHFGAPKVRKRFHKVGIDLSCEAISTLLVAADYNYGAELGTEMETVFVTTGGEALTDLGSNEAYFAAQIETVAEADIDGVANNVSLKISGSSAVEAPHVLTGVTYHISPRGVER